MDGAYCEGLGNWLITDGTQWMRWMERDGFTVVFKVVCNVILTVFITSIYGLYGQIVMIHYINCYDHMSA